MSCSRRRSVMVADCARLSAPRDRGLLIGNFRLSQIGSIHRAGGQVRTISLLRLWPGEWRYHAVTVGRPPLRAPRVERRILPPPDGTRAHGMERGTHVPRRADARASG